MLTNEINQIDSPEIRAHELEESNALQLQFEKRNGLLPVAVQESSTGQVLMIGYVNQIAFDYAMQHHVPAFWSTSRNELWIKGLTSGNTLQLDEVLVDCDQDALVYKVTLLGGGVCHTYDESGKNRKACFYRKVVGSDYALGFIDGMK